MNSNFIFEPRCLMQKFKILQRHFHHNQAETRILFSNLETQLVFMAILGYASNGRSLWSRFN